MILQLRCNHLNVVCHTRGNFPGEKEPESPPADLLPEVIKLDFLATEQSGGLLSKAVRRCMYIHNAEPQRKRDDCCSLDSSSLPGPISSTTSLPEICWVNKVTDMIPKLRQTLCRLHLKRRSLSVSVYLWKMFFVRAQPSSQCSRAPRSNSSFSAESDTLWPRRPNL